MLIVEIPSKITVYNLVENFKNNPHVILKIVYIFFINMLLTLYQHVTVDSLASYSVRIERMLF